MKAAEDGPVWYMGIDLRAPTRTLPRVTVPFDDIDDTTQDMEPRFDGCHDDGEAPELAGPWPDRKQWPATRRLFALYRFEREGNASAYENTRASLVERGVL